MSRKVVTQIPPKPVVRLVAALLLIGGLVIMYLAVVGYTTLGWPAIILFFSGLTTAGFATISLISGDPEWILLDLIIPG
jgi:hypothetical protein